jgi:uncharacterized protein YyaL (SSP411 family)
VVLLATRAQRPMPHRDDKIVTAWNGIAIAALARGARVLGRDDLAVVASEAAEFLRANLWHGGELYRSFRGKRGSVVGFPADYAFLISGLIELHAVRSDDGWLAWAHELQWKLDADFWDASRAGYVMRSELGGETLLVIREDYDGAEPAPNHVAAENLLKLADLLDEPAYRKRAEALLRAGSRMLETQPFAAPVLLAALDLEERGVMKFQVPAGEMGRLAETYLPRAVVETVAGGEVTVCEGVVCRIWK